MILRFYSILASLALFGVLAGAILALPDGPTGLTGTAFEHLPESGVTNPVTAVLLNYRGYDTLLEVAVLLLAVIATWLVSPRAAEKPVPRQPNEDPVWSLARLLAPVMVLGAGYFLWVGGHAPGGAFQAGAVLGGALVLLILSGLPGAVKLCGDRRLLVLGPGVFLLLALWPLALGENLLEYRGKSAKTQILVIEAAATVSIGLTLAALFLGARPKSETELLTGEE